jgi:hypothetical protein
MSWSPFALVLRPPLSYYTQGGVHITELVNITMATVTTTTITPIVIASLIFIFYPYHLQVIIY